MADTPEALQNALDALSAEIGRQRRQGLSCDQLIQEHRDLTARLRRLAATPSPGPGGLVREEIPSLEADGVREAWNDLLLRSDASSPSMSWEWQYAWHSQFAGKCRTSIQVVKEARSGRWVGLLPLTWVSPWQVSSRLEGYLPCRHLAVSGTRLGVEVDYTYPLIAAENDDDEVLRLLLEPLAEEKRPFVANHWDDGNPSARKFVAAARQLGFLCLSEPRAMAFDSLPGSLEEFVRQVPSATRRNRIRYYLRQGWLQDGEFRLETHEDAGSIVEQFPLLRRLSLAKYGPFSLWKSRSYTQFLESCVKLSAPRGWPLVWVLYRGAHPIGASMGWVFRDTCSVNAMTHDPHSRAEEPGHVLLTRVIAQLIERGVKRLDMHTAEGYKTYYLRQRRMRFDPLVLCPAGVSRDGALAGMLILGAVRKHARSVALRIVRSRMQTMSETSGDRGPQGRRGVGEGGPGLGGWPVAGVSQDEKGGAHRTTEVRRLKDGRTLDIRLATTGDVDLLAQEHPLPRDMRVPAGPCRAYYAGKCSLYVNTVGAAIVTGWVDGQLAGFVFLCGNMGRLRRTAKSPGMVGWIARQALLGRFGSNPLLWFRYGRWVLQHFQSPGGYRDVEPFGSAHDVRDIDAWIGTVHTVDEFRRLGVADALLAAAEMLLGKQGISEVALWAATDNEAALGLYGKHGYSRLMRATRIGEDCWLMVKQLR
jgi:ribosomal protein S18 acetylase RimI-like enzyme/CelD/BcsL family acetyltransferase involved in cellulose biosynthesis